MRICRPTVAVIRIAESDFSIVRRVITEKRTIVVGEIQMSLLGPDDFDLKRKDRKKKLAKDLSPETSKQIEKWLDRDDDPEALKNLSDLIGPEEAQRLIAKKKKGIPEDPLRDDL
jgi:hypothetical protein